MSDFFCERGFGGGGRGGVTHADDRAANHAQTRVVIDQSPRSLHTPNNYSCIGRLMFPAAAAHIPHQDHRQQIFLLWTQNLQK